MRKAVKLCIFQIIFEFSIIFFSKSDDVKNTNKQTSYKMIELLIMYWIGEVCTYKTKASHREFYNELQYVKYVYGAIIA